MFLRCFSKASTYHVDLSGNRFVAIRPQQAYNRYVIINVFFFPPIVYKLSKVFCLTQVSFLTLSSNFSDLLLCFNLLHVVSSLLQHQHLQAHKALLLVDTSTNATTNFYKRGLLNLRGKAHQSQKIRIKVINDPQSHSLNFHHGHYCGAMCYVLNFCVLQLLLFGNVLYICTLVTNVTKVWHAFWSNFPL